MNSKLSLYKVYKINLFESLSTNGVTFEVFNKDDSSDDNEEELEMEDDSVAGLVKNGKIVAGMGLTKAKNHWVVETAWANDPTSAYMLFLTGLKHYGALMPSLNLSPASRALIQRWYRKHYNDGSIFPMERYNDVEDWHNSIYTLPKGMDSKVQIKPPKYPDILIQSVSNEFDKAYADPDRTKGESLNDVLEKNDFKQLSTKLASMLRKGEPLLSKTKKWIIDNFYEIHATAIRNFSNNYEIDFWNEYIAKKYNLPKI